MTRKEDIRENPTVGRDELRDLVKSLLASIDETRGEISELIGKDDPLAWFASLKFHKQICNPLYPEKGKVTFLEFINQVWTTLATCRALEYLIDKHPDKSFCLNLGTQGGPDIHSTDKRLEAEVFATTNHSHNSKLHDDLLKLSKREGLEDLYVFAVLSDERVKSAKEYRPKKFAIDDICVQVWGIGELRTWVKRFDL